MDFHKRNSEEPRTEWMAIILGSWLAFVSSSQYSLYFTSLWPFMKTLDPSATEASFGVVIAAIHSPKFLCVIDAFGTYKFTDSRRGQNTEQQQQPLTFTISYHFGELFIEMPRVCISDASARPNGLPQKKCEEPRTEWMAIILGSWLAFVSSSQYSLYFTSLWPFMKTLDPSATEASFGVVIAAYSLAQIVAAPLLGFWANRIERLRPPLVLCNVLMFVGSSLYFVVEAFPTGGQTFMLICARFVAGSGAAQISTLRAYVSAASTLEDRSRATAFVTGGVAVGLSLGPAFQIAFSWLSYPGIALIPAVGLHLSMFNAPALFAACINIINVVILEQFFHESYIGVLEKRRKQKSSAEEGKQQNSVPKLPSPDGVTLRLCYLLRFTQQFIITNIETIGSAFAMLMFRWGPREVVYYESLSHIARGLTALFVYVAYIVFDLGKV
uniref:MFS domain-containing protein n=1 Tax=Globodera pallida TaxID=36090 RepID=A0A183C535_GLOPA